MLASVLTADFKYAWLGSQYRAAVAASQTLLARLQAQADSSIIALSASGSIKATGGNGKTVEFFGPESGQSPNELGELCGEMLRLYDSAAEALVNSGIASPADAQIYAEMKGRLVPIRSTTSDFTRMRENCCA